MEVIVLLLVLCFLVMPLVAVIKAFSLSSRVEELRRQLSQFHARLAKLEEAAQKAAAERFQETNTELVRPAEPAAPPALPLPRTPSTPRPPALSPPQVPVPPVLEKPAPPPVPPLPPAPRGTQPELSLEQFIGKKVFAWVGGLALFIGILFFVKYAFERNLIPPPARVAAGYVCGAGLVLGGWLKRRGAYAVLAQTLSATGILTLYGVTYAAHAVYDFPAFATVPAFLWMTGITALAIVLSTATGAKVTAVLGMLGGFLTPVLLSSGEDRAVFLFSYLTILNAGILAVTRRHGWFFLVPLAAAGTALLTWGWMVAHFHSGHYGARAGLWGVLAVLVGFPGLYLAAWRKSDDALSALGVAGLVFHGLAAGFFLLTDAAAAARPAALYTGLLALPLLLIPPALAAGTFTAAPSAAFFVLFTHLHTWLSGGHGQERQWTAAAVILVYGFMHTAWAARGGWLKAAKAPPAAPDQIPEPFLAALAGAPAFLLLVHAGGKFALAAPSAVFSAALAYCLWLLSLHLHGAKLPAGFRAALPLVAAGGAAALQTSRNFATSRHAWTPDDSIAPLGWACLFTLLFSLWPFVFQRRLLSYKIPWIVAAMAPVAHFPLILREARVLWPDLQPGFIPLLCGVLPGLSLVTVLRLPSPLAEVQRSRILWFSAAALAFVTLCVATQWKREWLTLGFALEGAALLWLHRRIPHAGLRATAVVLLTAAFVRLALNPAVLSYHTVAAKPWLAWHLYIYTLAAAAMITGARWLKPPHDHIGSLKPRPLLQTGAGVLLFLMLNLQITEWFARPGAPVSLFAPGGFARSVTFTIVWGLYALGLLILGFRVRQSAVRYAGIGLLGVTLVKLFLFDLAGLESIYRIAVFIAVALIALAASFLYQRLSRSGAESGTREES